MLTPIKIVFLGPSGCGKSTLVQKLCFDSMEDTKPTVGGDFTLKNLLINGKQYRLQFCDISGLELNSHLMKVYLRDSLGAFLVCDIQSKESLEQLKLYQEQVLIYGEKFSDGPIPMILLQNKIDLLNRNQVLADNLMLDSLFSFCEKSGYVTGYQTSYKTLNGLREALETLVKTIEQRDLINQLMKKNKFQIAKTNAQYSNKLNQNLEGRNDCFA